MTSRALGALGTARALLRAASLATVGLVTLVGVAGPSAGAATPGPTVVDASEVLPVAMAVTAITPQVLQPGGDLTVSVTIRNDGAAPIAQPHVRVRLSRAPFISRTSLDTWRLAGDRADLGPTVADLDLLAPLGPGQTTTATAVVPAGSVGLRTTPTSWGPRGLALEVVDVADPARTRLGLARTFLLWFPEQEVTATRVSVLVPLVGPAVDPLSDSWAAALEQLTGPHGRLGTVLAATADAPEATWVLDPWLLDAAGASTDQTTDSEPDRSLAHQWVTALVDAMTDRDVRLLPFGDTDVAALAHAAAPGPLDLAVERSGDTADLAGLPETAGTTIAWPVTALPDVATASFVREQGIRALVVGPGAMQVPDDLTYTPSGRTTASTAAGDVALLVPDARLSRALETGRPQETTTLDPTQEKRAADQLTGATAAQDLLAELAVITRERPNDARQLLMTVPRDWMPDPAVAAAQLDAISHAPWVHPETVSALVGAPDTGEDLGRLPATEPGSGEIATEELARLTTALDDRSGLARMFDDPAAVTGEVEQELLAPLSVAWRADPRGRSAVVARSVARTDALRHGVSAHPGETTPTLVSTTARIPLRVANSLDRAVTVTVSLQPRSHRLVADEPVTVTIPALGEQVIGLPVHAIQSADVEVRVELRTPDGVLVDDSTTFRVKVRAEWEGIGSAVLGVLLAIGLVVGIARTIRRGRSGRRAAPVSAGPDALSPEDAVEHEAHPAQPSEPASL
jgi:hypothetical protein